jgi:hypothetical protein
MLISHQDLNLSVDRAVRRWCSRAKFQQNLGAGWEEEKARPFSQCQSRVLALNVMTPSLALGLSHVQRCRQQPNRDWIQRRVLVVLLVLANSKVNITIHISLGRHLRSQYYFSLFKTNKSMLPPSKNPRHRSDARKQSHHATTIIYYRWKRCTIRPTPCDLSG